MYYGKYKGYVRDNNDPENRGRLRVYCPQVMGEQDAANQWLDWAEPCIPWVGGLSTLDFGVPYTKAQMGEDIIGVWVEFEGGRTDHPIWSGCFVVAPTTDAPGAQLPLADASGQPGGSIFSDPGGSTLTPLNPPAPLDATTETRLLVKKGRDLMLGVANGGYIILNSSGVHLAGVQLTLNGKLVDASPDENLM